MSYIYNIYLKIFFIIFYLFYESEEQLLENPKIIVSNAQYPAVFDGNDQYYHVITSEKIYIIQKLTGNKIFMKNSIPYSSPYFHCEDETNNHFLFSDQDYYKIDLDSDFENIQLNKIHTFNNDIQINGCFKHIPYNGGQSNDLKIEEGEVLLYGIKGKNIFFYYNKKQKEYDNQTVIYLGNEISCRLINTIEYFCFFLNNSEIHVEILKLAYSNKKSSIDSIKGYYLGNTENADNIIFYDTKSKEKKILCFKLVNTNECYLIDIIFSRNNYYDFYRYAKNIIFDIPIDKDNCAFTWFYSEYLICCSGENIISCNRINYNFVDIYKFNLIKNGLNSHLQIINNTDYASLFYLNTKSDTENNLLEYIIYPPTCQDISEEIIVFHDFEIKASDLFEMKTNNPYYLRFSNLPLQYGDFSVNDVKLNNNNEKVAVNQPEDILYFKSTNNKIVNHLSISYNVSIESTYSALCKIDLTIVPCYRSCHKCFKSQAESDEYNHNCI